MNDHRKELVRLKSLVVRSFGENADVRLEDTSIPVVKEGEALVRVHAAALNPLDLSVKSGHIPFANQPPLILGNEGAGVIESSAIFPKGTKVIIQGGTLGVAMDGTHQELMVVPEEQLVPLPTNFSFEEGAALSVATLTAYLALTYFGEVKEGEWVAISGASGAVGYAAVQLTKALGARAIAIVSTDEKAHQVLPAQPEGTINLSKEGINEGITRITNGEGINLAIDPVGGNGTGQLIHALAHAGRLVSIGYTGGMEATINLMDLLEKATKILGFSIYAVPREDTKAALNHIVELAESGQVRPVIDSTFSLDQWDEAVSRLTSRKAIGKVVFKI